MKHPIEGTPQPGDGAHRNAAPRERPDAPGSDSPSTAAGAAAAAADGAAATRYDAPGADGASIPPGDAYPTGPTTAPADAAAADPTPTPTPAKPAESRRGWRPDRPFTPGTPPWREILPALEAEIASDLRQFRKSMKAARMLPDYTNPDIFPPSRSGAWEIYHEKREVDGETMLYVIYVRRSSDQLAVNENGGHPYVLTSNFTQEFPWAPPTAEDLRLGMKSRMRALGVRPQ